MANWKRMTWAGGRSALFGLAAVLLGCQQYTQSVRTLPPPSFAAPQVASAPVAQAPLVMVPILPEPVLPIPAAARMPMPTSIASGATPRDWVPPVAPRAWRWIVIHHSATTTGGAVAFDKMHRAKGWDELGYDFVVGNGTDTADGLIEVGPRWTKQKYGAHAKTPDNRYNEYGIGICLVGNFDVERPTPAQMRSVEKLVGYLMKTYRIAPGNVLGHRDTKPTDCPGRYTDIGVIRRQAALLAGGSALAQANAAATPETELMSDTR